MRRLIIATALFAAGCGSSSSTAPSSPSSQAGASVNTITVSGSALSAGASTQLTATATLSNGTTQSVTATALWQSSSAAIATVSAAGLVTALAAGDVDITATYLTIVGRLHLTVTKSSFTLTGVVTDGTSGGVLPNISIQILDGANIGKTATTNSAGAFSLGGLSAGPMTVSGSASGYQTTQKSVVVTGDTRVDFVLPRTAPAAAQFAISTTASQGWSSIDVFVNGQSVGTLKRFFEPGGVSSCVAVPDARVVTSVSPGAVNWNARSDKGTTWTGSQTIAAGACFEMQLTCTDRNCGAAAPAPTPSPTPTPSPGPTMFYVWGGLNNSQYLGSFSCFFCTEFDADSINNLFSPYGNKFSSTSIRNKFSVYGGAFGTYSPCNKFTSTPPRLYNANRTVTYGLLTLNQFTLGAITDTATVAWLNGDICR